MRLLIVDDSEGFATNAARYFRAIGWEVMAARDGNQAKEALSNAVFDGIVLDRKMPPGPSGDEVLRWMSEHPEHQYTCVIMCTAYGDVAGATEALKLGAWQYVTKPVPDLALIEALLVPGVALKLCNRARSQLLLAEDMDSFFERLRGICQHTIPPAGLHLLFVESDGHVVSLLGAEAVKKGQGFRFVDEVVRQSRHVFAEEAAQTRELEPVLPDSKTILAVPVKGENGGVIGVLDMESRDEKGFGQAWQEVLAYIADLIAIYRVNQMRAEQAVSAILYREFRHRIATHAQVAGMQARELLEEGLSLEAERRARVILRNTETIDEIVRELREASTEHILNKGAVNLRSVLGDAERDTRTRKSTSDGPRVDILGVESIPEIPLNADRQWIEYCFACLLDNAWDAVTERWKQDVNWRESETGKIEVKGAVEDGNVRVSITDNGIGFEERQKEYLFTALYSTKVRLAEGEEQPDTGAGRVAQMLSALAANVNYDLDLAKRLDQLPPGFEIEIRDGETIRMAIRHPNLRGEPAVEYARLMGRRENHGIGLYTVRRIVCQHDGNVEAQSGGAFQGARFDIVLPLRN